jgi:hypothetical protein
MLTAPLKMPCFLWWRIPRYLELDVNLSFEIRAIRPLHQLRMNPRLIDAELKGSAESKGRQSVILPVLLWA